MRFVGTAISSAACAVILSRFTVTLGTGTFSQITLPSRAGFRAAMAFAAGTAIAALVIASFLPGRGDRLPAARPGRRARAPRAVTEPEAVTPR